MPINKQVLWCTPWSKQFFSTANSHGPKGLAPAPLGKNVCQAGHPICTAPRCCIRCPPTYNLLAALRELYVGSLFGTVLSLGWPPLGQLLRPVRSCAGASRSLRFFLGPSALRRIISRPPATSYTSATRMRPAAWLFDFASAPLPHNNQGLPRVAARRPPLSAYSAQHRRPRGGRVAARSPTSPAADSQTSLHWYKLPRR